MWDLCISACQVFVSLLVCIYGIGWEDRSTVGPYWDYASGIWGFWGFHEQTSCNTLSSQSHAVHTSFGFKGAVTWAWEYLLRLSFTSIEGGMTDKNASLFLVQPLAGQSVPLLSVNSPWSLRSIFIYYTSHHILFLVPVWVSLVWQFDHNCLGTSIWTPWSREVNFSFLINNFKMAYMIIQNTLSQWFLIYGVKQESVDLWQKAEVQLKRLFMLWFRQH